MKKELLRTLAISALALLFGLGAESASAYCNLLTTCSALVPFFYNSPGNTGTPGDTPVVVSSNPYTIYLWVNPTHAPGGGVFGIGEPFIITAGGSLTMTAFSGTASSQTIWNLVSGTELEIDTGDSAAGNFAPFEVGTLTVRYDGSGNPGNISITSGIYIDVNFNSDNITLPQTLAVAPTKPILYLPVGYMDNAADNPANCYGGNCGSVAYAYDISAYEITNAQYAEFLNRKAFSDPLSLYDPSLGTDGNNGGITQSGASGNFTYAVKSGVENKPVTYVSFYSALRFANWLNNGKGNGDTETGSYTLLGGTPVPSNATTIARNPGANAYLPSETEWYKAAFYSPSGVYFAYPYGTNTETTCAPPSATPNTANCNHVVGEVTDSGSYTGSRSPFGIFDQGGNVKEWTEKIVPSPFAPLTVVRGASWSDPAGNLAAAFLESQPPSTGTATIGFRVAAKDTDGDGLPDAIDNCPFTPNGPNLGTCLGNTPQGQALCHANSDCTSGVCSLNQEDTGGIGTGSPPDGIGDACQCGDVDNNGIVNNNDATLIKRAVAGIAPYPGGVTTLPGYNKCQVVNGAPGLTCNNTQATLISRAVSNLAPGIVQGCHAATIFP